MSRVGLTNNWPVDVRVREIPGLANSLFPLRTTSFNCTPHDSLSGWENDLGPAGKFMVIYPRWSTDCSDMWSDSKPWNVKSCCETTNA
jgi:hypothetical protein